MRGGVSSVVRQNSFAQYQRAGNITAALQRAHALEPRHCGAQRIRAALRARRAEEPFDERDQHWKAGVSYRPRRAPLLTRAGPETIM